MFKIRAVVVDYYLWKSTNEVFGEIKDGSLTEPILRIFGTTDNGVKSCVHIHGVYPYIYVPCERSDGQDRYALLLGAALNEALKGSSKVGSSRCVRDVSLVSGIPLYGYHSQHKQFFKISFYNPYHVKQASEFLLSGAILDKKFQPHEAHIPFVLQFMIDYNIYGMSFVTFSKIKYRRDPENIDLLKGVDESNILPCEYPKVTFSSLEVDAYAFDILNKNTGKVVDLNPGLQAFREEERNRMRKLSRTPSASFPESPPRRPFCDSSSVEFIYKEKLFKKLEGIFPLLAEPVVQSLEVPDVRNLINEEIITQVTASKTLGTESESEEERMEPDSVLGRNHVEDEEEELEDEAGEDLTQPLEPTEFSMLEPDADPFDQGNRIEENEKDFWNRMAKNIFQVDGPQDSCSESDRDSTGKNSTESLSLESEPKSKMALVSSFETWNCVTEQGPEANWTNNIMSLLAEDSTCLAPSSVCQTPQTFWSAYSPKVDFWLSQSQEPIVFNKTDSLASSHVHFTCQENDVCDISTGTCLSEDSFPNFSSCDGKRSNYHHNFETSRPYELGDNSTVSFPSNETTATPTSEDFPDLNFIPVSEIVDKAPFHYEDSRSSFREDFIKTKMVVLPRRLREPTEDRNSEGRITDVFESFKVPKNKKSVCEENKRKIISLTLKQYIKDCEEIVNVDFKNLCDRDMVIIEYKSLQSKAGQSKFIIKPLEKFIELWKIAENKINDSLSTELGNRIDLDKSAKSNVEENTEKDFPLHANVFQCEKSCGNMKLANAKSEENKFKVKSVEVLADSRKAFKVCNVNSYKINQNFDSQGNIKMKLIKSGRRTLKQDCFKSIRRNKILFGKPSNRGKKEIVEPKKMDIKITTPPDLSATIEKKESLKNTSCLHKKSESIFGKEKNKRGKTLRALDTKLIRRINSSFEKYFQNVVKVKNANFGDSSSSSLPSEDEEREEKREESTCWNRGSEAPIVDEKHCSSFLDPGDFVTRLLAALSGTARGSSPMQPLSVTVTFGSPARSISTPTHMNIEWGKSGPKKKRPKGKRRIQNVDGAADSSSEDSESGEPKELSPNGRRKVKRDTFYKPLNVVLGGSSFRRKKRKHGLGKVEEACSTFDSVQEGCFDVFRVKPESSSFFRGNNKILENELTEPNNCSIASNQEQSGIFGNRIKLLGSDKEFETGFICNSSEGESPSTEVKFIGINREKAKMDVSSSFRSNSDDFHKKTPTLSNSVDFELPAPKKDSEEWKKSKNFYEGKNDPFAPNIKSEKNKALLETEFEISRMSLECSGPLAKSLKTSQDVSDSEDKLTSASIEIVDFTAGNTSLEIFSSRTSSSDCHNENHGFQKLLNWPKGAGFEQCGRPFEGDDEFSGKGFESCEAEEASEFEKAFSDSSRGPKLPRATVVRPFSKSTVSATENAEVCNILENSRISNLTVGSTTLFPKRKPPKKGQIFEFLKEKKIFFNEPVLPFFGDPVDQRDAIEKGPRLLKIRSNSIAVLKTHKNVLETLGIEEKRHLKAYGAQNKNSRNLRHTLASRRISRIFPLLKPPTFTEVTMWLDSKGKLKMEKRSREVSQTLKFVFEFDHDVNSSTFSGSGVSIGNTQMQEIFRSSVDDDVLGMISTKSSNDVAPDVENMRECEVLYDKGPPNKIKGVKRFSKAKALETVLEGKETSEEGKEEFPCGRREGKPDSDSSFHIKGVTCDNTFGFPNSVENLNLSHSYQYVSLLAMEVHVQTRKEMLPDPRIDPVRAWFYTVKFDDPARTQENGVVVVGEGLLSGTSVSKMSVYYVATERALFEKAVEMVRNWDPEILAGYEIELNSWGYFVQRGFVLDLNLLVMLGRVRSEFCVFKQPSSFSDDVEDPDQVPKCVKDMRVSGRIVLDVWRVLRHEAALKSYTFESVMHHFSHERHSLLSYESLSFYWEHPSHRFRHITVEHYTTRVIGVIKLLDQLDFVNRTSELSRLFGIQFYEVLTRGSQYRVESMMLRLAKPLGYIPVSPSIAQRASMRAPASLPLIMEPESIFYSDPLIVLDFQSLYPSMIIAYNYCFSTCMGRVEKLGGREPFEFGCTRLQISPEEVKELENDITISPAGVVFVKPNIRKGILPALLETILETRLMVKKSMKENKNDKILQKLLFARQLGLKLIANVTYGYTAANFSGRMPCIEVGDSVVSKGRETLERAIKLIKSTSEWGAQVVYGDTDSIFVLTPGRTLKESFKIGEEIAAAVTQDNPKPVKLKLEKVYLPSILQTKKRYVGYMYESPEQKQPIFEAKGIEIVRRDGCNATEKILRKVLQILFDTRDVSLVKKYTLRQFTKIYQGKINLQDLIFAKEYRGRNGYRPGACVPALELARQWTKRDPRAEPRTKERVPYIIASGPPGVPLIRLVRSPKDFAKDPSLRPNADYYITKAIIPPLNRCLSLLGADVVSWYSEMPRKYHKILKTVQEEPPKRTTISQYFSVAECISCSRVTNALTCSACKANPQKVAVCSGDKIRRLERRRAGILKICQSCCGRQTELSCISLDCPVMFRRNQIEKEATQISGLREFFQVRE